MKCLSVFLVGVVFFLSFSGKANTVNEMPAKSMCCQKMGAKATRSNHKSADKDDGCSKNGCPMMFSCSVCGFFIVQPLKIQPVFGNHLMKPVPLYKIGDLSAYYPSDWKPPKTC